MAEARKLRATACIFVTLLLVSEPPGRGKGRMTSPLPTGCPCDCTVQGPAYLGLLDSVPTTMAEDTFSKGPWLLGSRAGSNTKDGHTSCREARISVC